MDKSAIELLANQPARVARWCGQTLLTDELHGAWMRQMIGGQGDMTLLSHRGSYKTSCLAMSMAISLLVHPRRNMLFLRKTDDDVTEIIRQVRRLLMSDAMQVLSARLYGTPVTVARGDMHSLSADCYAAPRGAPQLVGQGIGGSLTGKHADIIFTDDILEELRVYGIYVRADDRSRVIAVNSEGLLTSLDGWVRVGEYESDVPYAQGGAFGGPIMTDDGAYRYKLADGRVVERSPEEMAADELPPQTTVSETDLALIELAGIVAEQQAALIELAQMMAGGDR